MKCCGTSSEGFRLQWNRLLLYILMIKYPTFVLGLDYSAVQLYGRAKLNNQGTDLIEGNKWDTFRDIAVMLK